MPSITVAPLGAFPVQGPLYTAQSSQVQNLVVIGTSGCIQVNYELAQPFSALVDVLVEYDPDGGSGFRRCTPAGSELLSSFFGTQSLVTTPAGTAYGFQWNSVLDDPQLSALGEELGTAGRLDASSALALYDYLVQLEPDTVQQYVSSRIQALDSHLPVIRELAKARLTPDLDPQLEGSADLPTVGLVTP